MRIYAVKLNGSQFIIPAERTRSDTSLLTLAMKTHFPYTKGDKRSDILKDARINELNVVEGVAEVMLKSFELV